MVKNLIFDWVLKLILLYEPFFFLNFFLFYFHLMSFSFIDNSRWIEFRHAYNNYWFTTTCLYTSCLTFFYLIINMLFISHFWIFCCPFCVVDSFAINFVNCFGIKKLFLSIVHIIVRLQKFIWKLKKPRVSLNLLN